MNTLQETSVRMKTLQTTDTRWHEHVQSTLYSILRHQRFIYQRYQRMFCLGAFFASLKPYHRHSSKDPFGLPTSHATYKHMFKSTT